MFGFIIFIHVVICILLVTVILTQSGRGGGLTEAFSAAESMFGAKTNTVMVKATTVFAVLFLVTCLSLAFLSSKKNQSLLAGQNDEEAVEGVGIPIEEPDEQTEKVSGARGGLAEGKASLESGADLQGAIPSVQESVENIKTNPQDTEIKQDVPAESQNSQ